MCVFWIKELKVGAGQESNTGCLKKMNSLYKIAKNVVNCLNLFGPLILMTHNFAAA